jgi:Tfp pilus assembly protein PilF
VFQGLVDSGQTALKQPQGAAAPGGRAGGGRADIGESPRARTASAHYISGLGYLGLNDQAKAKAELTEAVQLDPDLLGARTALASLK